MASTQRTEVTGLLSRWGDDPEARERLACLLYDELRSLARGMLSGGGELTLQPTALVNEAFIRLIGGAGDGFEGRRHFFGSAARAMRQVLVDRARRRCADKRGGGLRPLSLDLVQGIPIADDGELLVLDEVLRQLEIMDARAAQIVELRYFGGLTLDQTAEVIGIHPSTVSSEWSYARAWLRRQLGDEP